MATQRSPDGNLRATAAHPSRRWRGTPARNLRGPRPHPAEIGSSVRVPTAESARARSRPPVCSGRVRRHVREQCSGLFPRPRRQRQMAHRSKARAAEVGAIAWAKGAHRARPPPGWAMLPMRLSRLRASLGAPLWLRGASVGDAEVLPPDAPGPPAPPYPPGLLPPGPPAPPGPPWARGDSGPTIPTRSPTMLSSADRAATEAPERDRCIRTNDRSSSLSRWVPARPSVGDDTDSDSSPPDEWSRLCSEPPPRLGARPLGDRSKGPPRLPGPGADMGAAGTRTPPALSMAVDGQVCGHGQQW